MKNLFLILFIAISIALGGYIILQGNPPSGETIVDETATTTDQMMGDTMEKKDQTVLGQSVEGTDIVAYHYGLGADEIIFIGGIHGGYEWNTALVAQEAANYFKANPDVIPANVMVTVIPVLNPDGLAKVVGTTTAQFKSSDVATSPAIQESGRYNARAVDLNRNFDCDWQPEGKWQNKTVSAGIRAFSEPETQAITNYIEAHHPAAVVVWYSAAGGVFASSCHNGVLPETTALTNEYAKASGYKAYQEFNFYEITGDMVNWLAKKEIPAISVLLSNHSDIEWSKNKAGIESVLKHFAQ